MAVRPISLVAALVATTSAGAALADSRTDIFGAREMALGESMRGAAQGALATTLNPAGLALDHQLVFEGTYGYRADDEAKHAAASACDSTVPMPGCFYYRYLDADPAAAIDGAATAPRRLHEFGSSLAFRLTEELALGVNGRYFDYNSDAEGDSSGMAFDVGLGFRPASIVSLGLVGYNLVAADSSQYPMGFGAGAAIRPVGALGIAVDATWDLDREEKKGDARVGGGAEYFLRSADGQSGYPVRIGGLYDAFGELGYLSGGLGFANVRVGLDVSARKQVKGGDEFALVASLRLFGPAQPQ